MICPEYALLAELMGTKLIRKESVQPLLPQSTVRLELIKLESTASLINVPLPMLMENVLTVSLLQNKSSLMVLVVLKHAPQDTLLIIAQESVFSTVLLE